MQQLQILNTDNRCENLELKTKLKEDSERKDSYARVRDIAFVYKCKHNGSLVI